MGSTTAPSCWSHFWPGGILRGTDLRSVTIVGGGIAFPTKVSSKIGGGLLSPSEVDGVGTDGGVWRGLLDRRVSGVVS